MTTHDMDTYAGRAAMIECCKRQLIADQAVNAEAKRRHEARCAAIQNALADYIDTVLCEPWRQLHADILRSQCEEKTPSQTAKNKCYFAARMEIFFSRLSGRKPFHD